MLLIVEKAVLAPHHHRNLAQVDIWKETDSGSACTSLGVIDEGGRYTNIYKERTRVGQVAKASIVWHHRENCTIVLEDGRLSQRGVLKFQLHLIFMLERNMKSIL